MSTRNYIDKSRHAPTWLAPALLSALAHGALAAALIAIAPWGSDFDSAAITIVEVELVAAIASGPAPDDVQPPPQPPARAPAAKPITRSQLAKQIEWAATPDEFPAPLPAAEPAASPAGDIAGGETTALHAALVKPGVMSSPATTPIGIGDNPKPFYPLAARRQGIEGRVVVQAVVPPSGESAHVDVVRSSGHAVLDRAALAAIKNWRFRPATRAGEAIEAGIEIAVVFRLEN